ncbi:MAG: prepilin-type N-terminal cleavage/methylation domain-containing protein [Ruminococcaceae bacterium]|nr:prepilin-type N-terminal cleavage/methylation domain-containing protein [Oscillospiraceae bacterium]
MEMVKMFRFIKTKKGFSLVELMIVVVIMAILVAVAVPIFNSVTGDAREKTCLDNQRNILSSVGRLFSMSAITGVNGKRAVIEFKYNEDGERVVEEVGSDTLSNLLGGGTEVTLDTIKGCFQTLPVCGDKEQTITLTITANIESFADVSVSCSDENHKLS